MSSRDDIAAAMTATGLVNVTSRYRQSLKPGDGCVRFAGMAQASNRFGWVTTWQVWVALPQDVAAAEEWLDANMAVLVAAFDTEVIVTAVTPAELLLGHNAVNGVIFEGTRATDNT